MFPIVVLMNVISQKPFREAFPLKKDIRRTQHRYDTIICSLKHQLYAGNKQEKKTEINHSNIRFLLLFYTFFILWYYKTSKTNFGRMHLNWILKKSVKNLIISKCVRAPEAAVRRCSAKQVFFQKRWWQAYSLQLY